MRSKNGARGGAVDGTSDPKQRGTVPASSKIRARAWHNSCILQDPGHVGGMTLAGLHVSGVRIGGVEWCAHRRLQY